MTSISHSHILVTGASGLIGRALAEKLAEHNTVYGLARFRDKEIKARLEKRGVNCIELDITSPLPEDLPDVEYVFNEAVIYDDEAGEDTEKMFAVNTYFVGDLINHYAKSAKAMVLGSSSCVYQPGNKPKQETDPYGPDGNYCASKMAMESLACYLSGKHDFPITILRYYWPYSTEGGRVYHQVRRVAENVPVGIFAESEYLFQPLYMDDCVRLTVNAAEFAASPPKIINLAGRETINDEGLVEKIEKLVGKDAEIIPTSKPDNVYLGNIWEMEKILGKPLVDIDHGLKNIWREISDMYK
jgi:UDP-glucuronate 4-epimerase